MQAGIQNLHHCSPCSNVLWHAVVQLIREVVAKHTGNALPEAPPAVPARAFGIVALPDRVRLMHALPRLASADGVPTFKPGTMESYSQP